MLHVTLSNTLSASDLADVKYSAKPSSVSSNLAIR